MGHFFHHGTLSLFSFIFSDLVPSYISVPVWLTNRISFFQSASTVPLCEKIHHKFSAALDSQICDSGLPSDLLSRHFFLIPLPTFSSLSISSNDLPSIPTPTSRSNLFLHRLDVCQIYFCIEEWSTSKNCHGKLNEILDSYLYHHFVHVFSVSLSFCTFSGFSSMFVYRSFVLFILFSL